MRPLLYQHFRQNLQEIATSLANIGISHFKIIYCKPKVSLAEGEAISKNECVAESCCYYTHILYFFKFTGLDKVTADILLSRCDMDRDKRLKELMKTLAETISQVFNENEEIKNAIAMIEKEGYKVDLMLATITRVSRKDGHTCKRDDSREDTTGISEFDRSFLKKIRIKLDDDMDMGS